MEEKIIYIDIDEEITSVVEKIRNAKEKRLILVFPKRANILQSIVNLKLLKRQSEEHKKEVVIVTLDRIGRHLASQVNFEVYQKISGKGVVSFPFKEDIKIDKPILKEISEDKAEERIEKREIKKPFFRKEKLFLKKEGIEEVSEKETAKQEIEKAPLIQPLKLAPKNKKILAGFLAVAFLFLFFIFYLILPQAKVVVFSQAKEIKKDLVLNIASNAKEIDYNKNIIPGELLFQEEEVSGEFSSQGVKEIKTKATGILTVKNLSPSTAFAWDRGLMTFIPENSTSLTFITSEPIYKLNKGEQVEINVTAERAGSEYNLPPGTKFLAKALIGDSAQNMISIIASKGTAGGEARKIRIISQQDIDKAIEKLIEEKKENLKKTLYDKLKPGEKIEDKIIVYEFLDLSTTPSLGQEGEKFTIQGKVKAHSLVFLENDFKNLILEKLKREISPLEQILENEIEWEIKEVKKEEEKNILRGEVKSYVVPYYPISELQKKLTSLDKDKAKEEILKLENIKRVEVFLWPSFKKNLPFLSSSIKIEIKAEK